MSSVNEIIYSVARTGTDKYWRLESWLRKSYYETLYSGAHYKTIHKCQSKKPTKYIVYLIDYVHTFVWWTWTEKDYKVEIRNIGKPRLWQVFINNKRLRKWGINQLLPNTYQNWLEVFQYEIWSRTIQNGHWQLVLVWSRCQMCGQLVLVRKYSCHVLVKQIIFIQLVQVIQSIIILKLKQTSQLQEQKHAD